MSEMDEGYQLMKDIALEDFKRSIEKLGFDIMIAERMVLQVDQISSAIKLYAKKINALTDIWNIND